MYCQPESQDGGGTAPPPPPLDVIEMLTFVVDDEELDAFAEPPATFERARAARSIFCM
ncbi:hypothetical protein [Caballeronia concitans]|uniref:Uncharacterized protein n=1 Tax=Caballeronia concitans TaxID=1777133 RepID=A0A658QWQ3_9BURK|nr:hypothetical protein [Caballeronia concitans]KIG06826.1 hypothetical protein BurMR1_0730 [Burkholderia sp. MR1]SAL29433.1 hypothetical protein AWB72_02452 [Caballeronia concitans]